MPNHYWNRLAVIVALSLCCATAATAKKSRGVPAGTKCHLQFSLSSWSAFYKSGKGQGQITCENGQSASVAIRTHGGGVTFGKSKIRHGRGTFTRVDDLHQLFGSYAESSAHVGASGAVAAHAIWNGDIGLALSGTGSGWDIGVHFGAFKITPR